MKYFKLQYLLIFSLFFCSFYGQEKIQSVFSSIGKLSGGYGSPYLKKFYSKNGEGLFVGGKGAFIFNRSFSFGGFGGTVIGNIEREDYNLGMGFGGIYGENIFFVSSPVHVSIATYIGLGGFGGKKNDEDKIYNFGVTLEPELNIEINLTYFLILAVGGSYQFVFTQFEKILKSDDFNGLNISIAFKFGRF